MSRLPTPGADDGTWGDILNDYLKLFVSIQADFPSSVATGSIGVTGVQTVEQGRVFILKKPVLATPAG